MKINADTITAAIVSEMADRSYDASMKAMRMYYEIERGEISPADAAAKLREILAPLQVKPAFRYFKGYGSVWKMPESGNGFIRCGEQTRWVESSLDLWILKCDKGLTEITAAEGEP
jgi:hypothetical protein